MSVTHEDFIYLVLEMREAQKQYFKTRTEEALRESISVEARVDEFLEDYFSEHLLH